MAMSNWDCLAIGDDGKPSDGVLTNGKYSVEIYKNWIYILDSEREDGSALATIYQGSIDMFGFRIRAIRGRQSSVLVFVEHTDYNVKPYLKTRMVGIGCYGYKTFLKELFDTYGVEGYDENMDYAQTSRLENDEWVEYLSDKDGNEFFHYKESEFELTRFVGVEKETVDQLKVYLNELVGDYEADKDYVSNLNFDEAIRFNQGDAYFAEHLGFETPDTKVGEADQTIMSQIIGK